MKQIPFIILLLLFSIFKCASENKIQTEVIPIETFQTRIVRRIQIVHLLSVIIL